MFVGRAQERTRVFRTEKRRNQSTGTVYPWIVTASGVVNQFYFYCVDADFGPFFLKFSSYFPYNAKLWLLWRRLHKTRLSPFGVVPVGATETELRRWEVRSGVGV